VRGESPKKVLTPTLSQREREVLLMAALLMSLGKQREAEEIRTPVGRPGSLAVQGSITRSLDTILVYFSNT
jgi:hypothetical protein